MAYPVWFRNHLTPVEVTLFFWGIKESRNFIGTALCEIEMGHGLDPFLQQSISGKERIETSTTEICLTLKEHVQPGSISIFNTAMDKMRMIEKLMQQEWGKGLIECVFPDTPSEFSTINRIFQGVPEQRGEVCLDGKVLYTYWTLTFHCKSQIEHRLHCPDRGKEQLHDYFNSLIKESEA